GDVMAGNHGGLFDVWIVRMDGDWNILWQRLLGGSEEDVGWDFALTRDGGSIITGRSMSSASGDVTGTSHGLFDAWIVKLDQAGNIEWQKLLGGDRDDGLRSVALTDDGGYILAGYSNSDTIRNPGVLNHGNMDAWVVKLDQAGNVEWQKLLGGDQRDDAEEILPTNDGFVLIGCSSSGTSGDITAVNHGGYSDVWVVKLDKAGNILWQGLMGGAGNDCGYAIRQTADGGLVFIGNSDSNASGDITGTSRGGYDFWVVKLTNPSLYIDILPIGDRQPGEKFTITTQTNLRTGTNVLVEVICSSLNTTKKSSSGEFSGVTGTIAVQPSLNDPVNRTAFDLDLSPFAPDITECLVRENASSPAVSDTEPFTVGLVAGPTTTAAGPDPFVVAVGILCGYWIIRSIVPKRK
ncbi:MAG TPA: hypothetical protein PLO06_10990, partial [Methanoregulaceae archaeon]|nr:hypothetical protein [Methanoregulaceae archaeon]